MSSRLGRCLSTAGDARLARNFEVSYGSLNGKRRGLSNQVFSLRSLTIRCLNFNIGSVCNKKLPWTAQALTSHLRKYPSQRKARMRVLAAMNCSEQSDSRNDGDSLARHPGTLKGCLGALVLTCRQQHIVPLVSHC
jgi:hypothetical protein